MKRLLLCALLAGCDDASYQAAVARAAVNERIREHCVPYGTERVLVFWENGNLVCRRWSPTKNYLSSKVITQAVAQIEDLE